MDRYGRLALWRSSMVRGPRRFLEVPVILVGPTRRCRATRAFVDGRGSRLAAGRTPLAEAGVPAAQAPDPGAVGTEVGLHVGRRRTDGGRVDPEQLRTPLQRRRDRPARSGSYQVPRRPGRAQRAWPTAAAAKRFPRGPRPRPDRRCIAPPGQPVGRSTRRGKSVGCHAQWDGPP
jgi:hypothetical protein